MKELPLSVVRQGPATDDESDRTFDGYQKAAAITAIYPKPLAIQYTALGLAGEAGEVANKVKKIIRDDQGVVTDKRRAEISKEIGGTLWYLAECCSAFGLSLGDVAKENLKILADRANRGVLQGSGDDR